MLSTTLPPSSINIHQYYCLYPHYSFFEFQEEDEVHHSSAPSIHTQSLPNPHNHKLEHTVQKAWRSSKYHFYHRAVPSTSHSATQSLLSHHLTGVSTNLLSSSRTSCDQDIDLSIPSSSLQSSYSSDHVTLNESTKDTLSSHSSTFTSIDIAETNSECDTTPNQDYSRIQSPVGAQRFSLLSDTLLAPNNPDRGTHTSRTDAQRSPSFPVTKLDLQSPLNSLPLSLSSCNSPQSDRVHPFLSPFASFSFFRYQLPRSQTRFCRQLNHQPRHIDFKFRAYSPLLCPSLFLTTMMDVKPDPSTQGSSNTKNSSTVYRQLPTSERPSGHEPRNPTPSPKMEDEDGGSSSSTQKITDTSVSSVVKGSQDELDRSALTVSSDQSHPGLSLVEDWLQDHTKEGDDSNDQVKRSVPDNDASKTDVGRSEVKGMGSKPLEGDELRTNNRSSGNLHATGSRDRERHDPSPIPLTSTSIHSPASTLSTSSSSDVGVSSQQSIIYTNKANSNGRTPSRSVPSSTQSKQVTRRRPPHHGTAKKHRTARTPSNSHSHPSASAHPASTDQLPVNRSHLSPHTKRRSKSKKQQPRVKQPERLPINTNASSPSSWRTLIMYFILLLGVFPGMILMSIPLLLLLPLVLVCSIPIVAAILFFLIVRHLRERNKRQTISSVPQTPQPTWHTPSQMSYESNDRQQQPNVLSNILHNPLLDEIHRRSDSLRSMQGDGSSAKGVRSVKMDVGSSSTSKPARRPREKSRVSRYYLTSCDEDAVDVNNEGYDSSNHQEDVGYMAFDASMDSWMFNNQNDEGSDHQGLLQQPEPPQPEEAETLVQRRSPRLLSGDASTVASIALYDEFVEFGSQSVDDDGHQPLLSSTARAVVGHTSCIPSQTRSLQPITHDSLLRNQQQTEDNVMMDFDFDIDPILALLLIIIIPILSVCCIPLFLCLPILLILLLPMLIAIPIVILIALPLLGGIAFFCSILLTFFLPWRSMWQGVKSCFSSQY